MWFESLSAAEGSLLDDISSTSGPWLEMELYTMSQSGSSSTLSLRWTSDLSKCHPGDRDCNDFVGGESAQATARHHEPARLRVLSQCPAEPGGTGAR